MMRVSVPCTVYHSTPGNLLLLLFSIIRLTLGPSPSDHPRHVLVPRDGAFRTFIHAHPEAFPHVIPYHHFTPMARFTNGRKDGFFAGPSLVQSDFG